ncbi:MAG: DUF4044 domain-containing protein [Acidimicrobiia bacterium]|nr:DUF4044 domain-containing protein [Acidimicrobiia bacterium]MPZ53704.1 DUF4044 domain-containing protein [Acidimicrobiia bacterium]
MRQDKVVKVVIWVMVIALVLSLAAGAIMSIL